MEEKKISVFCSLRYSEGLVYSLLSPGGKFYFARGVMKKQYLFYRDLENRRLTVNVSERGCILVVQLSRNAPTLHF